MNPEMPHRERLVRYLMGELSEEDQFRLEEEFFADPELLSEIQAICHDLMDDYLRDRLSASERQRCEQRLQSLPWLREKTANDQTFLAGIDAAALARQRPPQSSLLPFHSPRPFALRFPLTLPQAIAAAVLLGIFIISVWYLVKPARPADSQAQIHPQAETPGPQPQASIPASPHPTPNQPKPRPPSSPPSPQAPSSPVIASFLLPFDVVRGENDSPLLKVPGQTGAVQLQLELGQNDYRSYEAVLQTGAGETIRTWRNLSARHQQGVFTVAFRVPASQLTSTDYVVSLNGPRAGHETPLVHKYFFRIEKQ